MVSLFSLLLFFYLAGAVGLRHRHVRDHAGRPLGVGARHHRRRAHGLCGARRRPCGHPHRRGAGFFDGGHRRRLSVHVSDRLRRGGGIDGHGGEPAPSRPELGGLANKESVLYRSWWSVLAIIISHLPLGLLPHIGNKLWALQNPSERRRFIALAFTFGLTLGMLGLGGLLARAILGDVLTEPGMSSNSALALLFMELFPAWLAALLGVGILAAVMSTADGPGGVQLADHRQRPLPLKLCPQVRQTSGRQAGGPTGAGHQPRSHGGGDGHLHVHGLATDGPQRGADRLGRHWRHDGRLRRPLVVGAVWRGVTRAGAIAGLVSGAAVFTVLHGALIDPNWFAPGVLRAVADWLAREAGNPWSCASIGEIFSVAVTWAVSKRTQPLPSDHLARLFGPAEERPVHRRFGAT